MGKCFSGAENTEDIAQFEYKMKTQEIEITYQKMAKGKAANEDVK